MTLMNVLLINTGVFSTILVVLLVIWAAKPKNGMPMKKDLAEIKETVYGDSKEKTKKLGPPSSIVPLAN